MRPALNSDISGEELDLSNIYDSDSKIESDEDGSVGGRGGVGAAAAAAAEKRRMPLLPESRVMRRGVKISPLKAVREEPPFP